MKEKLFQIEDPNLILDLDNLIAISVNGQDVKAFLKRQLNLQI